MMRIDMQGLLNLLFISKKLSTQVRIGAGLRYRRQNQNLSTAVLVKRQLAVSRRSASKRVTQFLSELTAPASWRRQLVRDAAHGIACAWRDRRRSISADVFAACAEQMTALCSIFGKSRALGGLSNRSHGLSDRPKSNFNVAKFPRFVRPMSRMYDAGFSLTRNEETVFKS
ncbi:hypothetical protein [Paraburkholderia sp. D1E]|uniref:hypothetical protein n=1 Tax=Paraburkholderia sp. D1E TaxID=3461398 RepID=UPI0040463F6A